MGIGVEIPESDYLLIAKNCKRIPREAINLLLKRLVLNDMPEIFKENKIVHEGLNQKDIQILNCLNELTSPIGANFLSQRVGLIEADYCLVYEPFLIESGLIDRTARGRIISIKGKELLKGLKNEN
jgi:Holliday junction DNA helicase RuvB